MYKFNPHISTPYNPYSPSTHIFECFLIKNKSVKTYTNLIKTVLKKTKNTSQFIYQQKFTIHSHIANCSHFFTQKPPFHILILIMLCLSASHSVIETTVSLFHSILQFIIELWFSSSALSHINWKCRQFSQLSSSPILK